MKPLRNIANIVVAASLAFFMAVAFGAPSAAAGVHEAELDQLFAQLAEPEAQDWQAVERSIWALWADSGSAAMNLLLKRGHEAMAAGEIRVAVNHFTALIDHAPDFAEGWNARATALFHLGKFGASIDDIRHVLALNPRHFGALAGLGMIFEQLGDDETALSAYRAALSVHPHRPNLIEAEKRLAKRLSERDL